jgi:hypothetical protein
MVAQAAFLATEQCQRAFARINTSMRLHLGDEVGVV